MIKEKSCGAVIINENKVLLVKQNLGHISFPKGHVEARETEEETAFREVLEETGLEVEIDSSIKKTITYSPKENVIKDVVYFKAKVKNGVIKPQIEEISEVIWSNINDAFNLITYKDDKEVLKFFVGSDKNEY